MIHAAHMPDTPVGPLTLAEENGKIIRLHFGLCTLQAEWSVTPVLADAIEQLEQYFSGTRKAFSLPLAPGGTAFQQRCWQALCAIPYGQTRSYAQQAQAAGNPKACRAAGMANHANPIPILIPCHRVAGKNGSLTGYAGGLSIKETLLNLERTNANETA